MTTVLSAAAAPAAWVVANPTAAAGRVARPVSVVTSGTGGSPGGMHGMTADSFALVSNEPPLAMLSIQRRAHMLEVIRRNGRFAVSVLAQDQSDTARWFASRSRGPGSAEFAAVDWRAGPLAGAPLLEGAVAWFECRLQRLIPAGDHVLVLAAVLDVMPSASAQDKADPAGCLVQAGEPLLRYQRQYRSLCPSTTSSCAPAQTRARHDRGSGTPGRRG